MSTAATNDKQPIFNNPLDAVGKPVWLAIMVIGFIWWWPAGLVALAALAWTGRLEAFVPSRLTGYAFFGSGNVAFDEHRREMLREIDSEQERFRVFREKVAQAKDKSELDSFLAEQTKAKKKR